MWIPTGLFYVSKEKGKTKFQIFPLLLTLSVFSLSFYLLASTWKGKVAILKIWWIINNKMLMTVFKCNFWNTHLGFQSLLTLCHHCVFHVFFPVLLLMLVPTKPYTIVPHKCTRPSHTLNFPYFLVAKWPYSGIHFYLCIEYPVQMLSPQQSFSCFPSQITFLLMGFHS